MMHPQFDIRRLDSTELENYRNIRLEALRLAPEAFGSTYEIESQRSLAEFAERLSASIVYVACIDQRIVGMVGLKCETGMKDCHKGFIWGMYVQPEARQYGVGVALLNRVLETAAGMVEQLTLTVVKDNIAAIRLYQKLGFEIYGTEPRSMKDGDVYFDEILMVKFLQNF